MTTDEGLHRICSRLAPDGFELFHNVQAANGVFRLVARRSRFELSKFGIHEVFFVFADVYNPDPNTMSGYSAAAFAQALSMKKTSIPRGLAAAITCFSVAITDTAGPEVVNSVRNNAPSKHWAAFEIPLLWSPATGQVCYFEKTPVWGAAYYLGFRKLIQKYLG